MLANFKNLKSLAVIGSGGHAAVVLDAVQRHGFLLAVTVYDQAPKLQELLGCPILKLSEDSLNDPAQIADPVHIAIGNNGIREKLHQPFLASNHSLPVLMHPSAVVSPYAAVLPGTFIAALAIVGPRAQIGHGCIINHQAVVDHDCVIGDFAHIAPHATLGGQVQVGRGSLIGAGATVLPGLSVGAGSVVGAGAVVTDHIPDHQTVAGIPAKRRS